jgi:hypothetical protein
VGLKIGEAHSLRYMRSNHRLLGGGGQGQKILLGGLFFVFLFFVWSLFKVYKELQKNNNYQAHTSLDRFTHLEAEIRRLRKEVAQSRERFTVPLEPSSRLPHPSPPASGTSSGPATFLHRNDGENKQSAGAESDLPCLLTKTSTTPSFRMCTLDPSIDKTSKLLHKEGSFELVSHWPLDNLLRGITNPLVIDVGAGLGFISLRAAALGARVISVESHAGLAKLIRLSASLNKDAVGKFKSIRVVHGLPAAKPSFENDEITIDGVVGVKDVHLMHVASRGNGEIATLEGAHKLLTEKRVRYILLELCPQKAAKQGYKPLEFLQTLQGYGYNIFDDTTAEDGALTKEELGVLLHGIGKGCKSIFIARAM